MLANIFLKINLKTLFALYPFQKNKIKMEKLTPLKNSVLRKEKVSMGTNSTKDKRASEQDTRGRGASGEGSQLLLPDECPH